MSGINTEKLSQANQAYIQKIGNNTALSGTNSNAQIKINNNSKDEFVLSNSNKNDKNKRLIISGIIAGLAAVATGVILFFKGKSDKQVIKLSNLGAEGFKKLQSDCFTGSVKGKLNNGDNIVMQYVNGVLKKSSRTGISNIEKIYENIDGQKIVTQNINGIESTVNLSKIQSEVEDSKKEIDKILQNKNLTSKEIEELTDEIKYKSNNQKTLINEAIENKKLEESKNKTVSSVQEPDSATKVTGKKVSSPKPDKFIPEILSNPKFDEALKNFDLSVFDKNGIPLKYSLADMEDDLSKYLHSLSKAQAEQLQKEFNISFVESNGRYCLQCIPKLDVPIKTKEHQNVLDILNNFTLHNEVKISDPVLKDSISDLIKNIPEFSFLIGKQQNSVHQYSIDIHTLTNLQKALNYAEQEGLNSEQKEVLKISILLHDIGKKYLGSATSDTGHAVLSKMYASQILKNIDMTEKQKGKILNLIENHHWFKDFNTGAIDKDEVVKLFGDDLEIAKIMAKSDLESINNTFHLMVLDSNKKLSEVEYQNLMKQKLDSIQKFNTTKPVNSGNIIPSGKLESYKEFELPDDCTGIVIKLGTTDKQIALDNPDFIKYCNELKDGESFAIGCVNSTYSDVKIQIGDYHTDKVSNHHIVVTKQNGKIYLSNHSKNPTIVIKDIPTAKNSDPVISNFIEKLRNKSGVVSVNKTYVVDGQTLEFEVLQNSKLQGSNVGYFVINKHTGDLYYAKEALGSNQLNAEHAAIKLYQAAGIQVPEVSSFSCNDSTRGIISKYVPGLKSLDKYDSKEASKGFGMDVLLANWDVIGLSGDNIQKNSNGIFRIDAGGSFDYHAHQGGNKPFGSIPTELLTMLDSKINPQASDVFGKMSRSEMIESLKMAVNLKEEDILKCLNSTGCSYYANTLLQRQKFIAEILSQMEKTPQDSLNSLQYMQKVTTNALSTFIQKAESESDLQDISNSLMYLNNSKDKNDLAAQINKRLNYLKTLPPKIIKLSQKDTVDILKSNGWNDLGGCYSLKLSDSEKQDIYNAYNSHANIITTKIEAPLYQQDIENITSMLNVCNGEYVQLAKKDMKRFIQLYNCIKDPKVGIFKFDGNGNHIINPKMTNDKWQAVYNILNANQISLEQMEALLSYKSSSHSVNNALTQVANGKKFSTLDPNIQKRINEIQSYLNTQVFHDNITLYRGEGYEVLDKTILPNGKSLAQAMIEAKNAGQAAIDNLRLTILSGSYETVQERFVSTSMLKGHEFTAPIVWEFDVQKGSKGVMLEGINILGSLNSECEVLLQKDSKILIEDIEYKNNQWYCKAKLIN